MVARTKKKKQADSASSACFSFLHTTGSVADIAPNYFWRSWAMVWQEPQAGYLPWIAVLWGSPWHS